MIFNTIPQLKGKTSPNRIVLVCCKVIGFAGSSEAFLIDSTSHHDLAVVDDSAEHGSGRLQGRELPPLRLLVVVHKHLVEGFAVEMKGRQQLWDFFYVKRCLMKKMKDEKALNKLGRKQNIKSMKRKRYRTKYNRERRE